MRQAELLRKDTRPTILATATTQGINDDDACSTCGYELGTSTSENRRECTRCLNYFLAQAEAKRVKAAKGIAALATAAQRTNKELENYHDAKVTATDDAIIVETKADTTKEEEEAALLPVLAKALNPFLSISSTELENRIKKTASDLRLEFENLAAELRDSQKQIHVTRVEISTDAGATVTDAGIQHKLFPRLVKMLNSRDHKGNKLNIWIMGPAGTGKTSAAENAAIALGMEYASTGALSESYKLFGFMSPGNGQYVSTPFRKKWEFGGLFILDDFDGTDPTVGTELNNALANGGCTFPDGYVKRHPDCCIVLTANTWGLGATNDYVGRMKQDAAFLDRFAKLHWPIDEDLELATAPIEAWTRRVQEIRANVKTKGLKVLVTPRASYYGAALLQAGLTQEEAEESCLKAAMSDDQWRSVQ